MEKPAQLAVFDFDGTSLSGNSPVLLVRYLVYKKMLSASVLARIMSWGVAYKFRLPQNESWVRSLVFTAFEGKPKEEVDAFLYKFYDEVVEPRFRKECDATILSHLAAGHKVVVVSATFEPIVLRAMQRHPYQYQICTKMKVDAQGRYTREVEGLPVEGAEKLAALTRFSNAEFGEGHWELAFAYGDHHSDRTLLSAAKHAFAVTPDNPLERTAKERGWTILNWGA